MPVVRGTPRRCRARAWFGASRIMDVGVAKSDEWVTMATSRVRDAQVRMPPIVDADLDLVAVCRCMAQADTSHVLVRNPARGEHALGMFTTTDLRDAMLQSAWPAPLAVGQQARFELVRVQADADLFEAMWLMVRHRVQRIVVFDGETLMGVLSQLDLVQFLTSHSHLIGMAVDDAPDIQALADVARRWDQNIVALHAAGIRVERIAHWVGELNRRLFARAWALIAPADMVANSCLLVMGSEGRGEQLVKTDQDNALILRDGFNHPAVADCAQRFSEALALFGYPPCPGFVMVTNPLWRRSLAGYEASIHDWFFHGDPEGAMHLAIFFDAVAVAGDAALLAQAKATLDACAAKGKSHLVQFAAAADQFHDGGHWFKRLTGWHANDPIDLKKLGVFPIVHGVRALALQAGVREASTLHRLEALEERGAITATMASELTESLSFLMAIRLRHQLLAVAAGQPAGNAVRPSDVLALERQTLEDVLDIVKGFRVFLREHFHFQGLR